MPGIIRTDPLTAGPFRVGTRWREIRKVRRKEVSEDLTVTALEPGSSFATVSEADGMRYITTWAFLRVRGGTEIVMRFHTEGTNPLLASPLNMHTHWMLPLAAKTMKRDVADLVATAEARAAE